MNSTTLLIPEELKARALLRARELGVSLDEFICDALRSQLERVPQPSRRDDPFFRHVRIYEGDAPDDSALNHDEYLYGDGDPQ